MENRLPVAARKEGEESFESVTLTAALKRELRRLVDLVTDEDDCRIEVLEEISNIITDLKLKHNTAQKSEKADPIAVPEYFLCPISSELMADPVVLATGQTYDRAYIQEWFDADHVTCPKTEQVLSHTVMTPNYLVQTMIQQWCRSRGLEPPNATTTTTTGNESDNESVTPQEAKYVNILLAKLSGDCPSQQREAARQLRVLTRKKPSHRIFLGKPTSLGVLIPLVWSPDSETQEHAVTTLLNLSIHDKNKTRIAEEGGIHPIVEVLKNGISKSSRENAAAALFSLCGVDENKVRIGSSDAAIPALVDLLREGSSRGKKDAASAMFSLCMYEGNKSKCVRAGAVPLLLKFMSVNEESEGGMGDESTLAMLAILSSHEEGAKAIGDAGAFSVLLDTIVKETSSVRNKENAVVILVELCSRDCRFVKEVKAKNGGYMALVDLSLNGTSRSRRKAKALLDRVNRVHRLATI